MRAGRFIGGIVLSLVGAALLAGSISILTDDRDEDDFFVSHEQRITRASHAVVSEDVDVLTSAPGWLADWLTNPVDVRIRGGSTGGGAIFVGIAETEDVRSYLDSVARDEVTSLDFKGSDVRYRSLEGSAPPGAPGIQGFWEAAVEGNGEQTLDWSLRTGNWSVVIMNADGSAGIDAEVVFGARISNVVLLMWIGLALGVVLLPLGAYVIYRSIRPREATTG